MAPSSSVRVEFEDSILGASKDLTVDAPDPKPPDRRLPIAAAAVLGLALVVGLFALQPSDGETAAGTERQAPTTTSPNAATTDEAQSATTTAAPVAAPTPEETVNAFLSSDVVRGPGGFLALLDSESDDNFAPSLHRSEDGITWEPVETELAPFIAKGDITFVEFSHLIASGEGFGVLRTRTTQDRLSPKFPAESVTERLVSLNGERWELDQGFTPLLHNELAQPAFHVANSFGFFTDEVTASAAAGDCEGHLAEASERFSDRSLLIHRFGRTAPEEIQVSLSAAHTQLAGATVASFVPNGVQFQSPAACQRFPGISADFPAPTVQVIDAANTVRQIALPDEVTEGRLTNSPDVSLVGTDAGLVAILGQSVWRLDLASEEWTRLLDIAAGPLNVLDYLAVDDGQVVALLSEGTAITVDVATAEFNSLNIADNGGLPIILYADDELVITPESVRDDGTRTILLADRQPVRGAFPGEAGDE